jgi:class 3 adenylate cyclase/TolB-like protein/tetratricopeptide (TPR) repeat protein
MFTDIVGYSSLSHRDENLAMELLEAHRAVVRPLLTKHNGREIKTIGDAFLVEFGAAIDAVSCAIEIQDALAARNDEAPADRRVEIRIGIHLGDVMTSEDGGSYDVYGDGVNIAARVQSIAGPRGICVSQSIYDQVHNKLNETFVELGPRKLKNISTPVRVYGITHGARAKAFPRKVIIHSRLRAPAFAALVSAPFVIAALIFTSHGPRSETAEPSSSGRVAVLPFDNLSGNDDDEYLSEGMCEELITTLSNVPRLRVLARTSVARFRGAGRKSVAEIGKELNVATIIEGSVRRVGDKLRIGVSVVDARRQDTIWSGEFDGKLNELLAIQKKIAGRVIGEFKVRFIAADVSNLQNQGVSSTVDHEAYLQFLRGRFQMNKRTPEALSSAEKHFKKAIGIDPKFDEAYSGLSTVYGLMGFYGMRRPAETQPQQKLLAARAVELDPNSAVAHTALAEAKVFHDHDWKGAEEEYRRAIELSPSYPNVHHWHAEFLMGMGRTEDALRENKLARELDPLSPNIATAAGYPYYYAGKYDEAIEAYKKSIELDPKFYLAHVWLGRAYTLKKDYGRALASLEHASSLGADPVLVKIHSAVAQALSGKTEEARKLLRELEAMAKQRYVSPYDLACVQAALGDKDAAITALSTAFSEFSTQILFIRTDPLLQSLRDDPRYKQLVRRAGFSI